MTSKGANLKLHKIREILHQIILNIFEVTLKGANFAKYTSTKLGVTSKGAILKLHKIWEILHLIILNIFEVT